MKAVEFKNVYFRYGPDQKTILRDVNLALDYGKVVLFAGPSGSGKTTLMSLLNGAIPNYVKGQFSGEILINGESIYGKGISELSRSIGSVLQNADSQIVHDLVKDEIAFGQENTGIAPEQITESVKKYTEMLKLDPLYRTRLLSGGQKQRLITASTLAMEQKIVILDEPLANLDREGAGVVLGILKDLAHGEGYLVIIVEHRIDYIIDYVDEIYDFQDCAPVRVSRQGIIKKGQDSLGSFEEFVGTSGSGRTLLTAENICMTFGMRKVLENISLEIKEADRILIMGENGCGKTTFTKILARLMKPTSGNISSVLGSRAGKSWFKQVGYVYQNPDYQLFMPTAEREIDYACVSKELKDYVIDRLELGEFLGCHSFSLSQGQKRKLAVAAIVCMQPKILFLDEPTVGQDNESLVNLIEVLLHLNKEYGTALVTVTHDSRCAVLGDKELSW